MLRVYLYPAVANEILIKENILKDVDTQVTDKTAKDMIELDTPQSLNETVTRDTAFQSEEECLLKKMWGLCDD